MKLDLKPYDVADYLTDDETIAYYLIEAFTENETRIFAKALGSVMRALGGVGVLAQRTGLSEKTLNAASSESGDPDLSTILKILAAFQIRVSATRSEPTENSVLTAA